MRKISLLIITVFFCQSVFATTYAAPDISLIRSELRKSMQTQYDPVKQVEQKKEEITFLDIILFYTMNVFSFVKARLLHFWDRGSARRQKGYWFLRRAEYFYKKGDDEKYRESMHKAFYWFQESVFQLLREDTPQNYNKNGADSRFMRDIVVATCFKGFSSGGFGDLDFTLTNVGEANYLKLIDEYGQKPIEEIPYCLRPNFKNKLLAYKHFIKYRDYTAGRIVHEIKAYQDRLLRWNGKQATWENFEIDR